MLVQQLKTNIIYAIGSAANSAALLLLIPYLINAFTPAEYGVWALLEISILLLAMLITAGVDIGLMREYWFLESDNERRRLSGTVVIAVSIWGTGIILISSAVLYLLYETNIITSFYPLPFDWETLILVLVISLVEAFFNLLMVFFRIREQAGLFASLSLGKLVLFLAGSVIGVELGYGLNGALAGRLFAALLVVIVALYLLRNTIMLSFNRQRFRRVIEYGLPLLPTSLALYILFALDRYILQHFSTLEAVAVYAFAYKVASLLDILVTRPFAIDWAPRRFKIATQPRSAEKYAEALVLYLFAAVGFALLVLAISPVLYAWVAPPHYAEGISVVPIILVAYVFHGLSYPLNVGIMLKDKTRYLPLISWLSAGVCIGLNIWLVPVYGIMGAAWATLISYAILTTGIAGLSLYFYPIAYPLKPVFLIFLGVLLGGVGFWGIGWVWRAQDMLLLALIKLFWIGGIFAGTAYLLWGRGRIALFRHQ
jgi:O-antigen/teichoic acid export membrane protein